MAYEHLLVVTAGPVTTITINRPEVLNALDDTTQDELDRAIDAFAGDATQRLCVLTGAGERAFCAGTDLKAIARGGRTTEARTYPKSGYGGIAQRFDLAKPIIAAVNGVALGGGFEIALACDLIVASSNARFGLPEPKVGGMAIGGGVHRLVRQIGIKQAMDYILTGRMMHAAEAERLGLVNRVVEPDGLMAAVDALAEQVLACSPAAIAASKEAAYRGLDEPSLAAAISGQNGYPAFQNYLASPDRIEGARAFAEKRKPQWA